MLYENHSFQCMRKIFCVEFQRVPLKFHTKYLAHNWKMWILFTGKNLRTLRFKSSSVSVFETPPVSIKRCRLTSTGNPVVEIRLFQERRFYLHDGISYRVGKSVSLHQDIEAGDAYMRQWTRSSLVVACLLCGTSALDKIPRDIGSALHYLVMP